VPHRHLDVADDVTELAQWPEHMTHALFPILLVSSGDVCVSTVGFRVGNDRDHCPGH
jgi:hypothetical protein